MAAQNNIILITGGNSGVGLETARQLIIIPSNHVIIGCRSAEKGQAALKELQSLGAPGSVELVELDVTKDDQIYAAAKKIDEEHGRLDVLVNNAAVATFPDEMPISQQMKEAYATNVVGPWMMGLAFAPLLQKSPSTPRIVNVSSSVGSIASRFDPNGLMHDMPGALYRADKAALNMITACQAVDYGKLGVKVFSVCPGFVVSNLGPYNKPEMGAKPVSEGGKVVVKIVNGERDAEHGSFLHSGGQYPW